MTIKIKAPVIWLDDMSKRLTQREKKYRAVPESDWRKLMKLVSAADALPNWTKSGDLYMALAALEKKK